MQNVRGPFSLLPEVRSRSKLVGVFDKDKKRFHQELIDTNDQEVLIKTNSLDLMEDHDRDHFLSLTDGNRNTGEALSGAWAMAINNCIHFLTKESPFKPNEATFGVDEDPFDLCSPLQTFASFYYYHFFDQHPEWIEFYAQLSETLRKSSGVVKLEIPPEKVQRMVELVDTTVKKFLQQVSPENLQFYWERFEHFLQEETPAHQTLENYFQAAKNNEIKKNESVLEKDIYLKKRGDTAAMMWATRVGSADTVKNLINQGVDFDAKDGNGQTPLMNAVKYGHTGVIKDLVKAGANLDLKNNQGKTAIDMANGNKYLLCLLNKEHLEQKG